MFVCVPQPLSPAAALASGHYIHSASPRRWGLEPWRRLHPEPSNASVLRETSVTKKTQKQEIKKHIFANKQNDFTPNHKHGINYRDGMKMILNFHLITFSAVVSQHAHFFNLPQQRSVLRWNTHKAGVTQMIHTSRMNLHTDLISFVCAHYSRLSL